MSIVVNAHLSADTLKNLVKEYLVKNFGEGVEVTELEFNVTRKPARSVSVDVSFTKGSRVPVPTMHVGETHVAEEAVAAVVAPVEDEETSVTTGLFGD